MGQVSSMGSDPWAGGAGEATRGAGPAAPDKLPAKQRPRAKSQMKRRRKQARHFVRVTMRNGLSRVLRGATRTQTWLAPG